MRLSKYQCPFGPNFVLGLSPAAWFRADTGVTVTGQGASTWADQSGNGRDLLQGTDASRPPYLSHSGTKYLYLPGVAGNYASTPDSAANSITGDIDIRVRVAMADWTPAAISILAGKLESTNQRSYAIDVTTTGVVRLTTSPDGTAGSQIIGASTASVSFSDGVSGWVRATLDVDDGLGNRVYKFYTAADSSSEPSSWTQLGSTVTTAGTTSIFNSTSIVEVGSALAGTSNQTSGKIYRAIIKSGIDGTTVVDFNPDRDASDASTSFASSATGETWTVNSSGGLPAQIVGRSSILFDGVADYLKCNAFTLNQPETVYIAFKQVSWTLNDVILDGNSSNGMALYQSAATPQVAPFAGSAASSNGNLAVGSYGALCAVFNGASSLSRVNNTADVTGNVGVNNAGGFCLGSIGAGTSAWANIQVLEVIIAAAAHSAEQRARVIQYLSGRHGIAL